MVPMPMGLAGEFVFVYARCEVEGSGRRFDRWRVASGRALLLRAEARMTGTVVGVALVVAFLVVAGVGGVLYDNRARRRYLAEAKAWADQRGWTCQGKNAPLVEGMHAGHRCTLEWIRETYSAGTWTTVADSTVVVMHLDREYPAAEVRRRSKLPHRATGTIGYEPFDKAFRVRTAARRDPAAVVSDRLAKAHVDGSVPLWSLEGRALTCTVPRQLPVTSWDEALTRAVWVAELLGVQ
jgi:hypothetical protein